MPMFRQDRGRELVVNLTKVSERLDATGMPARSHSSRSAHIQAESAKVEAEKQVETCFTLPPATWPQRLTARELNTAHRVKLRTVP